MKQYLLLALLTTIGGLKASSREGEKALKLQITGQTSWFDEYEKSADGETVFGAGCQRDIAKYRDAGAQHQIGSAQGLSVSQFLSAFWGIVTGKE